MKVPGGHQRLLEVFRMAVPSTAIMISGALSGPGSLAGQELVRRPAYLPSFDFCEQADAAPFRGELIVEWNAMEDENAFATTQLRFGGDGSMLVVDRHIPAVFRVSHDGATQRQIGRTGRGPGEYTQPIDAVFMGSSMGVVVGDRATFALNFYDAEGNYLSRTQAERPFESIAADGRYVYVGHTVPIIPGRRWPGPQALVSRYDTETERWESLMHLTDAMMGDRPFYRFAATRPLVRVGLDGHLYVGFPNSYDVWRVDGQQDQEHVLAGCLPEELRRTYEAAGSTGVVNVTSMLISDFAVTSNGHIVVRVGTDDGEGHRYIQEFDRHGRLVGNLSLPPEVAPWASGALHPQRPMEIHATFSRIRGVTRIYRTTPVGH